MSQNIMGARIAGQKWIWVIDHGNKKLECAMEEMFDFIGDIPSRVIDFDFQCDYDEAFAELEKVKSENVVEFAVRIAAID